MMLIWLVLFKFKFNISPVLHSNHRSLNLIPFAAPSMVHGKINYGEMILNCLFFVPLGLLLNVNFKKTGFLTKVAFILCFSVAAELIQYIFAIGATDITDVITNTFGGLLGLILYNAGSRFLNNEKLDRVIISFGFLLFIFFICMHASHYAMRHS